MNEPGAICNREWCTHLLGPSRRVKIYIVVSGRNFMIGQGILNMITLMFMSLMEGINYDPGYVLSAFLNAVGVALAIIGLLILVVLQLLGIIPNPWPWMI